MGIVRFGFAVAVVASVAACGNPLVGQWTRDVGGTAGQVSWRDTLALNADGTASVRRDGMGPCSGRATLGGISWSASGTVLTLAGTPACTGDVRCTDPTAPPLDLGCAAGVFPVLALRAPGAYVFGLTAGASELVITGDGPWVRQP